MRRLTNSAPFGRSESASSSRPAAWPGIEPGGVHEQRPPVGGRHPGDLGDDGNLPGEPGGMEHGPLPGGHRVAAAGGGEQPRPEPDAPLRLPHDGARRGVDDIGRDAARLREGMGVAEDDDLVVAAEGDLVAFAVRARAAPFGQRIAPGAQVEPPGRAADRGRVAVHRRRRAAGGQRREPDRRGRPRRDRRPAARRRHRGALPPPAGARPASTVTRQASAGAHVAPAGDRGASSSSSMVRGQSSLSRRDSARSASSCPPVWQRAQ